MLQFQEKRKLRRFVYSRLFLILMLIPIAFFSYVAWNARATERETHARKEELSAELAQLEARASALERDIATLSEPRGVEAELRKRYDVGREGEEAIVLIDDEPVPPVEPPAPPPPKESVWKRIIDVLF